MDVIPRPEGKDISNGRSSREGKPFQTEPLSASFPPGSDHVVARPSPVVLRKVQILEKTNG
jgi:hypothetical protein